MAVPQAGIDANRDEWARAMRAKFSPAAMLNPDASINQNYFRPKQARIDRLPLPLLNRCFHYVKASPPAETVPSA